MGRSRSAEQTARVLLSSAIRHDTWECRVSSEAVGGTVFTARFVWEEWPTVPAFQDAVALHMTFYDRVACAFVGATYTVSKDAATEPLIFRNRAANVLLVVEVVARDERRNAPVEERRVLMWGHVPLTTVCAVRTIALRPGNAQLLQLNSNSWPSKDRGETCSLNYTCVAVEDVVLTQLMSRLVPPGIIVPQSFTESTPQSLTHSFRCTVRNIHLFPAQENTEWHDKTAEWRVAAVAHNGYQQLGQGAEVPLVFDDDTAPSVPTTSNTATSGSSSLTGNNPSHASTSAYIPAEKKKLQQPSLVHSALPLEMDGLPVHSATSLVLAIRRRRTEEQRFEVIGFCVFPLCVMPMKDRDLRVENLPTLQGPFSCRDPRMLMLEASSPYGKLPLTVTLTVEYHDTLVSDPSSASVLTSRHLNDKRGPAKTMDTDANGEGSLAGAHDLTQPFSPSNGEPGKSMGILSTEELEEATAAAAAAAATAAPAVLKGATGEPSSQVTPPLKLTYPSPDTPVADKPATEEQSSVDVFKMLCGVMEELRRLREMQEAAMRRGHQKDGLVGRGDETGRRIADAAGVEVVDLSPMPIAISWETRCQIEEGLQPIRHPVHGTRLEDHVLASSHDMTTSLNGIRFEGLTADASIHVPEDICFIFSFGSLPLQTIGPVRTACIDKSPHLRTFKLYEGPERGGMVWCEPLEAAGDPFLQKYHQHADATVYIHVYDALTMFYLGSVNVQLGHFRRPYNAENARIPMDLPLYRDLSLTERSIPPKIFPIVRNAGQLHVTLFCVAAKGGGSAAPPREKVVVPPSGSRVIVAKKLPHANIIEQHLIEGEKTDAGGKTLAETGAAHPSDGVTTSQGPPVLLSSSSQQQQQQQQQQLVPAASNANETTHGMHWRRAQHVKQMYGNGTLLPGVPNGHQLREGDLEFRLRYLEKQRDEMKSRKIAEALMERLTAHHYMYVASCRPEVTRTPFQNPFSSAMRFSVEVDNQAKGALETLSPPSFYLGPRERAEVVLVVRLNALGDTRGGEPKHLRARVLTDGREVVRIVDVHATVGPPFVDRRFEIYGPAGTEVSKKIFSRIFSSAMFPITSDRLKLLSRMRDMCARVTITSETTTAEVNAVLDPITQTFVTAWEEVTVRTTIPRDEREQRVEYLVLYKDAAMSDVIETWELCIFACQAVTSRELLFGQTTTVALPASGIQALYCSHSHVKVERRESSYLLHVRPPEVGTQQLLLHALTNHHLAKTLMTIPTVYPTPTYTQTLEFSLADTTAPIFRRLQFVHRGAKDEVFTVHHNYKYQLRVTPKQFALAPSDTQFITLQIDMLSLPEGQMEGRWPMWIFINNAADKTIESYLLHVVLRAHRVLHDMA